MNDSNNNINKSKYTNLIKIIIGIGMLIAVVSLYILISLDNPKKPLAGRVDTYDDNIKIGGSFKLIDQNNKVFNSDSLSGKLSMIYFGFTYCPDICPTSLQKITEVLNVLDNYNINITPVFVTIDPKRDTPTVLKEYLKNFHPRFIGLTGSQEQIKEVADQFKVYYAISSSDESGSYMIDHSSFVYLMNEQGKYLKHFYLDSSVNEIINFFMR